MSCRDWIVPLPGEGYLVVTGIARERLHVVMQEHAVLGHAALRTHKTLRSAALFERHFARLLLAAKFQKLVQTHAGLKLYLIHLGHDYFPCTFVKHHVPNRDSLTDIPQTVSSD